MSELERWVKKFRVDGETYLATFTKRPFREGLQASISIGGELVEIGELGLGEKALIERLKSEVKKRRPASPGS